MTESVAELLQRVEQALDEYERADETTRTVELLTRAEMDVSPHVEDLEHMVDAFNVLTHAGRIGIRPDTSALARTLRATAAQVRQKKTLPLDHSKTLREVQRIVDGARLTARENWRESIEASMPGLDGLAPLANVLSQLGENPAQVEKLRREATELRALSKELPDESAPSKVTQKISVIEQALMSLLGDSRESGDVRKFIEMAARGGAPVRALTPAVMDWMRRNNTEGSFKIISGRPASE
jgi:hypothetical protein